MKNKWIVLGAVAAVLAIVATLAIGTIAFAQGPVGPRFGMGHGWMTLAPHACAGVGNGGFAGFGGTQNSLIAIAAQDLNTSADDLIAELNKGKSIADIAKEKGVSADKIVDDFIAAHSALLKSAVDSNRITQAQSDAMFAQMKANARAHLDSKWTGGAFGFGMLGPRGQTNALLPGGGMMGPRGGMMGTYGGWR